MATLEGTPMLQAQIKKQAICETIKGFMAFFKRIKCFIINLSSCLAMKMFDALNRLIFFRKNFLI